MKLSKHFDIYSRSNIRSLMMIGVHILIFFFFFINYYCFLSSEHHHITHIFSQLPVFDFVFFDWKMNFNETGYTILAHVNSGFV